MFYRKLFYTEEVAQLQRRTLTRKLYFHVLGESVAGKSTFINLLVGVDILPTSQLSCTATFCELRYSNSKYAVCYVKDGRQRKIDLSHPEGIEELKQEMSYITDDVDDNENEKILVFWPFDILEVSLSFKFNKYEIVFFRNDPRWVVNNLYNPLDRKS